MKRTKQQWLELIQTQQTSDLSIVDFCREKDLPLKSFYARRSSLLKPKHIESSVFSKVAVANNSKPSTTAITLNIGKATLSIPSSTDVVWLAKLIGQFA
jgi:diketogulonate reductase-like aldo/keto reductase|tara:strand:+ start:258 stop:554 length:297 start_codon:yes stop_codon:yes gene_type:complete